nr:integrase, catalytic region, zinc finger, CCHC-type, peptidase aspartic, catalytic [Tanacetum cinerariifolium]
MVDDTKPIDSTCECMDLKAQLQEKGIAISELKKLIEKMKGKYVDTKFDKSSVIGQPNAFKSQRPSILGVISPTSVSRPQLKSNQLEDRVLLNNSQGKKQEVEDHRRNVTFSKNKTFVTACNESLNAKTSMTKMPMVVPISTRGPKRTVEKFVAKPLRRTVASESTNQKPRNITRKLYEHVSKACSWWYPKFTPPGYNWKPKSQIGNVNPNLIEIILFIVDSGCSKHMTGNLKLLINFVEKFMGTVKFRNDQIAPILVYGDLNRTLVEAARTMLSAAKVPLLFWAEAIATSCFTQNRSLVIPRQEKTPYHIINDRKPSVKFFYIFGSLYYIVRDGENLDKMKEKVVLKSSTVTTTDAPIQCQQQLTTPLNTQTTPDPTRQVLTQAPTITSTENINQAETSLENVQGDDDEFINIFCTPVQGRGETSSRYLIEVILFIVDSGCSKHMTGNLKLLTNFVEKFLGSVKFGNDQIETILGYGYLVQGTVTIKRVYYVEGLNHNLFSVGQLCDADLEVAFRKSTCYICDLKGNDLLTGSRGTDLYSITLQDTSSPNPA